MVYTHGYMVFKDEEAAREYVKKRIQRSKEFWEEAGKDCTEVVEKVKRKGKKEIHIFSFTFPMIYNYNKISTVSRSYVTQEN